MASSSRLRVSSSSEEDVARGTGVQPYRFETRNRSNSGDEESAAGELTLRYNRTNTRIEDVSLPGRFAAHSDRCSHGRSWV